MGRDVKRNLCFFPHLFAACRGFLRLFPLVAKDPAKGWRGGCASLSAGGGPGGVKAKAQWPLVPKGALEGARPTTFGDIGECGVVWRALSLDRFSPAADAACRRYLRCVEKFS